MNDRYAVILNPASANGATGKRWPRLAQALRAQVSDFQVFETKAPGHATTLTVQALEMGFRSIVSVGGDGTHNEVVNGCIDDQDNVVDDVVLSVLPTGTGGDFRRSLGLPNSALDAVQYVGENPRRVDIGRIVYTTAAGGQERGAFINISSFGVSGHVVDAVNTSSKALGGKASFLMGVARGTLKYKNQPMRIVLDPDEPGETVLNGTFYNGVVANAQYFGGGMHIAPDASMTDGVFDVVFLGNLTTWEIATGTPALFAGTHLERNKVTLYRARIVRAEPLGDAPVLIETDGERAGQLPAEFSLISSALTVCSGPGARVFC